MTYSFKKAKKRLSSCNFTLMEIVAVLVIFVIISSIVVANVKLPVFASLDKTTKSVRKIFANAQRQTSLRGTEIIVIFEPERKEFKLMSSTAPEYEFDSIAGMDAEAQNPQWSLRIPANIEVEFPDYDEETIKYRFFPDGSASGPEMTLTLKKRTMIVGVSRLTGIAYSREEKE